MSFGSDLDSFAKKAPKQVDEARRKTVLDLFSAIIKSTPVDTGRAKGNWQTSVGTVRAAVLERMDPTGQGDMSTEVETELLAALAQWSDDDTITLANGLPYILRLEDGSSKQAPAGMARRNVKRFEPLLKAAAAQART